MNFHDSAPDHERWMDSPAPYLLHSLEEAEVPEFEAHLDRCVVCQDEVQILKTAADMLPVTVAQIEAPPALKGRIMAVVEREAELLRAAGPEADRPPAVASDRPERRRWWWRSMTLRPAGALASVVLLLIGGVIAGTALRDAPDRVVRAAVEIRGVDARLEMRDDRGRLAVSGLPAPPEGRVYQVWLQRPGKAPEPTNALFSPHDDGTSSVAVPGRLDDVERVLVTHEPRGGSPVPTRAPLITVSLS